MEACFPEYEFYVWDPDGMCAYIGGWWMCTRPDRHNCCACSRDGVDPQTACFEGGFDQFACQEVLIKDGAEDWDQCEFHEEADCQVDDTCAPLFVYKWRQPPDPAQPDNVFYGWNEESICWDLGNTVADDFLCTTADPVTSIRWWGSFKGWEYPFPPPPEEMPIHFHFHFWTDVPAGVDQEFSHPGRVIHEILPAFHTYTYEFVGWDYDPRTGDYEAAFLFQQDLEPWEWFFQDPGEDSTIYWLSVSACYN